MILWTSILVVSYLLGSIPFGFVLVWMLKHEDVRQTGSGNIGATNVARSGGKGLGLLTLLLDTLKGVAAVLLALHFAPRLNGVPSNLAVAAAVAAVVGHIFTVWLGFKGGKGIATALGVFLALLPMMALACLAVFIVVFALTRYVSLASILAALSVPLFTWLLVPTRAPVLLAGVSFISLLSIVKHHANIRRLLSGTESKFGSNKAAPSR
ncbi:acyl-phosphate glycerol-3-phosphate acyltransferase [Bryocella elongata]|uniref:Glycerol-3-phosphate acyltransferase n=1 Tax=Bryocella elongata TaxID=863522 RepID=A0A1H5X2F2_9BACT|nr:glycerol-3-phosphate 1-O-acyltransferase PlsY [Bryocella elongata]SEG06014.1 acyl-phosphate glycerol-3-phosphate acyltransferase [Bryocella elongata]